MTMKYFIDEQEVNQEQFESQLDEAVYAEVEDTFDDTLNECYESYKICSTELYPGEILKRCDPVLYRVALLDEVDYQSREYKDEFERGDERKINGIWFKTEEDNDDQDEKNGGSDNED